MGLEIEEWEARECVGAAYLGGRLHASPGLGQDLELTVGETEGLAVSERDRCHRDWC